jgi:hypothetical protein
MVSPQTSRKCLREIISVSPNTEFTARIHSDYGRVRYRKSNYVTKGKRRYIAHQIANFA